MIRKQDILDRSVEWQLRPEVVEKDYVLDWLLAGLAQMPFGELWIFKGGYERPEMPWPSSSHRRVAQSHARSLG